MDTYNCEKCGDEWQFIPEDYDYEEHLYPTTCPLCGMPVLDMIRDVYKEEGLWEVIRRLWIRL